MVVQWALGCSFLQYVHETDFSVGLTSAAVVPGMFFPPLNCGFWCCFLGGLDVITSQRSRASISLSNDSNNVSKSHSDVSIFLEIIKRSSMGIFSRSRGTKSFP